jgi:hypothetical protein
LEDAAHDMQAPAWLKPYLRTLGMSYAEPLYVLRGTQSACYIIECSQSQDRIAVKIFEDYSAKALAGEEYAALQILHEALHDHRHASAPRPLGLIPAHLGAGYVMSAVEGVPLDKFLKDRRSSPPPGLAMTISRAVAAYQAAAGRPYGDFHPANVLVSDEGRTIALIDPTCPSGRHAKVEASLDLKLSACLPADRLMAMDVGYWLYSVVIRAFRGDFRSAREIREQFRIATQLIGFIDAQNRFSICTQAALEHLRFPRPNRSARARFLGVLTGGTLRSMALYARIFPRRARR